MLSAPGQCLRLPLCLEQFSGPTNLPVSGPSTSSELASLTGVEAQPVGAPSKGWVEMGPHQRWVLAGAGASRRPRPPRPPGALTKLFLVLATLGSWEPRQGLVNAQEPGRSAAPPPRTCPGSVSRARLLSCLATSGWWAPRT